MYGWVVERCASDFCAKDEWKGLEMNLVDTSDVEGALRRVYGQIPSGVLALGASVSGQLVGMAVSSFSTVSLDPPLLAVNIRNESTTWPHLAKSERIGISLLAHHQGEAGRQLSGPDLGTRFTNIEHVVDDSGAVFLTDALLWMDATHYDSLEAGDHTIHLLRLERTAEAEIGSPLVFHRSRFTVVAEE